MSEAWITGGGAVTGLGFGRDALFSGLVDNRSGILGRPWFASDGGPVSRVSMDDPAASALGPEAVARGWALTEELALCASREALAGLEEVADLWVVGATTTSGMQLGEQAYHQNLLGQVPSVPGDFLWRQLAGRTAAAVQRALGAKGQRLSVSAACVSGSAALGLALDVLNTGRARRVLVVGAESLCSIVYYGFGSLGVHSPTGSTPFDAGRNGMSIGEGAAALLLEHPDAARERGAVPMARLTGYGNTMDAHHLTAPDPSADGAVRCIQMALGDLDPARVDFYDAHGTGTELNDAMEALAVSRTVPGAAVAGIKGAIGHTLGAAGVVEALVGAMAIEQGVIPPSVGLTTPLDDRLDLVTEARRQPVRAVLSTNFAFGGNNAAVLLEAP